jgi:hypothetical protein
MANVVKQQFLEELERRFGRIKKLPNSLSLFDVADGQARIYYRYSKVHGRCQTFYGLRKEDLRLLEGTNSLICFSWDNQHEPLFIPFSDYEEVLSSIDAASDGQSKLLFLLVKKQNCICQVVAD